uniref:Uncharacterized protein n=1 Tax=Crouania attenuata TaxID=42002 RepID=A0A4D6WV09_9FLOR|nr:hypothetical protein [Crouania attenuata]
MLLSDLLFILKNKVFYSSQGLQSEYVLRNYSSANKLSKSENNSYCIEKPLLLSRLISKKQKLNSTTSIKYVSVNAPNVLERFVNRYWQETIVISYVDSENKIANINNILYSHEYKNLLTDFGKAIINGQIMVKMNYFDHSNSLKSSQYLDRKDSQNLNLDKIKIFYSWKKNINIFSVKKIIYLFSSYTQYLLLKLQYLKKSNYQELHLFPIFSVVNLFNQMILAESTNRDNFLLDSFSKNVSRYSHTHIGLFFINPKDALEYKKSIQNNYQSITDNQLKVFPSKLSTYYRLQILRLSTSTRFRIIPDLREVSKLLTHYQYYKNISINSSQLYGKDYFQGQPIYMIKPFWGFNKQNKKYELMHYSYNFAKEESYSNYDAVFCNFQTVIHAWQKFKTEHKDYKLPNLPEIEVLNLEYLLKEKYHKNLKKNKMIFIPSYESYQFIQEGITKNSINNIRNKVTNRMMYLKVISQRILWSLTSRQPIKW